MQPRHVDVLLVGGGVAAARCARRLRREGFGGSIILVGEEATPPYNRPPLSKEVLRGEAPDELVLAEPRPWYERRGVELLLGTPAVAVDPGGRTVELADGRRLEYGQLLLATGAEPRQLAIPGGEGALALRTLGDAVTLRGRAVPGHRAAVIGGGFIGVEVAASLAARGCVVTLLERADALWAGTLGGEVSAWAADRLAAAGVEVRLSAEVRSLAPGRALVDGAELPADLVVVGVGVEPRTRLAEQAGLAVDDGVVVDERQATSDPAIFAAGDLARRAGEGRVEHWHAARESGERAALGMLGRSVPAPRAPWIFSEFTGASLDVVGWALPGDERVATTGAVAWLRDERLAQLAILDGAVPVEEARTLVEGGGGLAELRRLAPRA